MSALRTFWHDVVGIDKPKLKLRTFDENDTHDTVQETQEVDEPAPGAVKERLAALFGPYKKAVADTSPYARHLQALFDEIKSSIAQQQLVQAEASLDAFEELLDEHTRWKHDEKSMRASDTEVPEIGAQADLSGLQTADTAEHKVGLHPAIDIGIGIIQGALGPLSAKCIVTNNTGHTLKLDPASLEEKPHRGEFETPPPAQIPPGTAEFKAKNRRIAFLHWTGVRFTVRYQIDQKTFWTLRFDKFRIRKNKVSAELSGPNAGDFKSKSASVAGKDAVFYFSLDPVGNPDPTTDDPPTNDPVEPAGPTPQQEINASCLVTIKNDTQVELKLSEQTNERGDFMTQPAATVPPGASVQFAYVTTPKETELEKQGCKGSVTYAAGTPVAAVWRCEWDNLVGEKNTAEASLVPQTVGFASLAQTGQGDENVPVTFTISGGDDAPAKPDDPGASDDDPPSNDDPPTDDPATDVDDSEPVFDPPVEEDEPTLRKGDKSVDGWVEYLQSRLNPHVDFALKEDGIFGKETLKAVIAFQKRMKAKDPSFLVDGIVGNQTWAALRQASPEAPGIDGRKPGSFTDRGAKARWLRDNDKLGYYSEPSDELELILVSVGDQTDLEGEKANVFVTAPGCDRKGVVARITLLHDNEDSPQGGTYRVAIADFTKKFPSKPEGAPVSQYLVEAYFDKALGGDFVSTHPRM